MTGAWRALVGCHANDSEARSGARRARTTETELPFSLPARRRPSPSTGSRRRRAARAWASSVGRGVAGSRVARARVRGRRGRLSLLPRACRGDRGEHTCSQARRAEACRAVAGTARRRAGHRLRPSDLGRQGRALALGHDDARPRRSGDRLDLAALVPARHAGRDPLPWRHAVLRQDQLRVSGMRAAGLASDREGADRARGQLLDHGQLPRFPRDRGQARRRVDRRRPPLFQRSRRPVRIRHDQSPAGLSAADRAPGARLRPLPPYGLRPLPRGAPTAVRACVQEPGQGELRADRPAQGRQYDHEERRGRAGRRIECERPHRALVCALRLRTAAWAGLPITYRRIRGRLRADHRLVERLASHSDVHASRRGVLREGDRGRSGREDRSAACVRHATRR